MQPSQELTMKYLLTTKTHHCIAGASLCELVSAVFQSCHLGLASRKLATQIMLPWAAWYRINNKYKVSE